VATILVVDDSKFDRRFVGSMLNEVGKYEVKFAENGEDALSEMRSSVPDLVVTDLFMPVVDGLKLVARTRQEFPLVPIVLITSKGSEELAVQALQRGAASYVPKQLLSRYLIETVRNLLDSVKEQRSRATLLGTMQSDVCDFTLSNDVNLAHALVGYILESMAHIGMGDETARLRTCVALEEALVNAIHHGNLEVASALRQKDDNAYCDLIKQRKPKPPYCHRRVQVQVKMSAMEAEFVIRDEGPGFDVATLPDPRVPENLEKAMGRGVMLMRTFMDEVNYNAKGNTVTMIKLGETITTGRS
jgi:CheY-like chemotaxis protein/anti-sigma regulatory factor (Ser/Thr protein kinase)